MYSSGMASTLGGVREDLVLQGVKFWNDEKLASSPAMEKEEFLLKKGLNRVEVQEVRRRAAEANAGTVEGFQEQSRNGMGMAGRPYPNGGPMNVQYVPVPVAASNDTAGTATPSWFDRISQTLQMVAGVAAGVGTVSWAYQRFTGNVPPFVPQNFHPLFGLPPPNHGPSSTQGNVHGPHSTPVMNTGTPEVLGSSTSVAPNARTPVLSTPRWSENTLNSGSPVVANSPQLDALEKDMKHMYVKMEEHSKQFRETLTTLNEILKSQSSQSANQASMGLLLSSMTAKHAADEKEIRSELRQIREKLGSSPSADSSSQDPNVSSSTKESTDTEVLGQNPKEATTSDSAEPNDAADEDSSMEKQDDGKEEELQKEISTRCAKIDVAVENTIAANDAKTCKVAHGMLNMVLQKLADEPSVPRYRKLTSKNKSFEQHLSGLKGIDELLEAIGFNKQANNYEWTIIPKSQGEDMDLKLRLHAAVINHAKTKLEGFLRNPKVGKLEKLPEKTEGSLKATCSNNSSGGDSKSDKGLRATLSPLTTAGQVSSTLGSGPALSPSTPIGSQAPYPSSFQDVLRMAQEGVTPPGVKEVPNKLSDESTSLLKMAMGGASLPVSAPKPWDRSAGTGPEIEEVDEK